MKLEAGLIGANSVVALLAVASLSCGRGPRLEVTAMPDPNAIETGEFELRFSDAIAGPEQLAMPIEAAFLELDPPLKGSAQWRDEQTLVYFLHETPPPSTRVEGRVKAGLISKDGERLERDVHFQLDYQQLTAELLVVDPPDHATPKPRAQVSFSLPVRFADVRNHCHFQQGDVGARVPVVSHEGEAELQDEANVFRVRPQDDLSVDSDWKLRCEKEIVPVGGNLGLANDVESALHTFGALEFVAATTERVYGEDLETLRNEWQQEALGSKEKPLVAGHQSIHFVFTNRLADDIQMTAEPAIPNFPDRCNSLGSNPPGLTCQVQLAPRTDYKITIDETQEDQHGQRLGKSHQIALHSGDAAPGLSLESGFVVAEDKRIVLPLWTRNVGKIQVRAARITAPNFHKLALDWWSPTPIDLKGIGATSSQVETGGTQNEWSRVDLSPAKLVGSSNARGLFYLEVGTNEIDTYNFRKKGVRKVLVNFTNIGVTSKLSSSRGLLWATHLDTGAPMPNAMVEVRDSKGTMQWRGKTNAQGLATLPARAKLNGTGSMRIFVRKGGDMTMLDPNAHGGLSAWSYGVPIDYNQKSEALRGFMHTDRGLYRPGETVHFKGLARVTRLASPLAVPSSKTAQLLVKSPRGQTVHTETVPLSEFGGFWGKLKLPANARLGDYIVHATLPEGSFTARFAVEEYRPATFEVIGQQRSEPIIQSGTVTATLTAKYLYGAPLRKGDVDFTVHRRPRSAHFKGFEGYRFARPRNSSTDYETDYRASYSQELVGQQNIALDSDGQATLSLPIGAASVDEDADLLIRGRVTSPSGEAIDKSFVVPYFKWKRYVGIKSAGHFVEIGKKQTFAIAAVNSKGKRVSAKLDVAIERHEWNCVWEEWGYRGNYQCSRNRFEIRREPLQVSAKRDAKVMFMPERGGEYRVVVRNDSDEIVSVDEFYAWGDGGGSWRSEDNMRFDLLTNKKEYKAGDTATILLKTDIKEGTALVTIERDGVIQKRLEKITEKRKHINVPIKGSYAPNVFVSVSLVQGRLGEGERGKPQMRMGLVNLPVRPDDVDLDISIRTDKKEYRPGELVQATLEVRDRAGKPVRGEFAVTAADEGVLALINYKTPNPTPTFYAPWGIGVHSASQYQFLRDLAAPDTERDATGGDAGAPGSVRSRFMSTAVWEPGIVTNAQGKATVRFKAPDNLTAFRLMAVGADSGRRFGSAEKRFTVAKPLQLHRMLPRFLTIGDKLDGGVVIHNESDAAGSATITVVPQGPIRIDGPLSKVVALEKGDRRPVRFEINGTGKGVASLRFRVEMAGETDAIDYKIPVHHPSPVTTDHLANGLVKNSSQLSLTLPESAELGSAELSVSVDALGLAGIEEGLRSLVSYPYGCLEQTTSKVAAMLAVGDLASALDIEDLKGEALDKNVEAGLARISRHQRSNGGFSLWPGSDAETYYTAYAAWGLHLARERGYVIDQSRIDDALNFLQWHQRELSGAFRSNTGHLGDKAFALYVRSKLGRGDVQAAIRLRDELGEMPVYGKAFLARALAAELGPADASVTSLVDQLLAKIKASKHNRGIIRESEGLGYYMSSDLRTTAIVLDTLLELQPESEHVPELVRAIMRARRRTRHLTTQENIWSLLALQNYAKRHNTKPATITIRTGKRILAKEKLSGKTSLISLDTSWVNATDGKAVRAQDIIVEASGGTATYSVNLRYHQTPESLEHTRKRAIEKALAGGKHGLAIRREYLDEADEPIGSVAVGDVVKVRLTLPLDRGVEHLMVSDRLPAGFEALNNRFATLQPSANVQVPYGSYRELRDERVDFASKYNWRSTYVREYLMRATSEGEFAVPPTHAELMYEPETYGQTTMKNITVAPRKPGAK